MNKAIGRRRLLGACAGAVVAAAAAPLIPSAAAQTDPADCESERPGDPHALLPRDRIGIQLYTVRDQISSQGFAKVLERLARIGFKEVEFAGYNDGTGITATQLRQLLDDNGLRAVGSHVGLNAGNVQQQLDIAEILGLPAIGIASWPAGTITKSQVAQLAGTYNQLGEACAARGVRFYFHNHYAEWAPVLDDPTKSQYLELIRQTDPALVFFEMDLLWAYQGKAMFERFFPGGLDPLAVVLAARDRFPMFHVKDGNRANPASPTYDMTDVGQGTIPFAPFFRALNDASLPGEARKHHYLNENDNAASKPHGSLGSAAASYGFMRHGLTDWTP